MIPQHIKKQIIDQTNIVEVVGEVVSLTKKGSSYFGLCPFHDDKHPSMSVNNEKRMFNCFSCNTKGNVIFFFSKFHHLTEDQATIQLAKRLGIEISEQTSKEALQQERLLKTMKEASSFYHFYLNNSQEGLIAKKYLHERGIDDALIETLQIGLASSERDYLYQALKGKNCPELDQVELGLIKLDAHNHAYDIFRQRIMFPVTNPSGQVVGFSGRIYQPSDQAKYINSIDNAIFHKGQILYHFYEALSEIRKQDKVMLLEGFMDVIACMKAGIGYGVATMGTALTKEHIQLILGVTKNIVLCFDGDDAGVHAMKRSASLLARFGILPRAVVLPNQLDPDEYLQKHGKEALRSYIERNEKSVYDWLYDLAIQNTVLNDLESAEKLKKNVFEFLRFSKQNTIIDHFLKKMAIDLDVSVETLKHDFGAMPTYIPEIEIVDGMPKAEKVFSTKPIEIKKKVFRAYDVVVRHMIESKKKFLAFTEKFENTFYIDNRLSIYFDFIKKMGIYFAENDEMDEEDFMTIAASLDTSSELKSYTAFAKRILMDTMVNVNDNTEFEQCLKTIEDCVHELSQANLYNKAMGSKNNEDIQKFETIRKRQVKIVSGED